MKKMRKRMDGGGGGAFNNGSKKKQDSETIAGWTVAVLSALHAEWQGDLGLHQAAPLRLID